VRGADPPAHVVKAPHPPFGQPRLRGARLFFRKGRREDGALAEWGMRVSSLSATARFAALTKPRVSPGGGER